MKISILCKKYDNQIKKYPCLHISYLIRLRLLIITVPSYFTMLPSLPATVSGGTVNMISSTTCVDSMGKLIYNNTCVDSTRYCLV